jgi:hypothetical protein
VCELLRVFSDVMTLCSVKVVDHAVVKGEERSSCTNFGTHVTDRGHTRARKRVDAWALVLHNSTSATLDRQNTCNFENDICERS